MPLGLAQSDVFPHPCSILGKKKTEKWQLLSGPLWLLNSKRILIGLRTGKRVAGPRKRMQQPGGLRSPVAPGACLGLRVKAQVTATHLGRKSCQLLVNILSSPSLFSQTSLNSFHVCRLQGSLSKRSCKPRSLPNHRPRTSGCPLKVCLGIGKEGVVSMIDRTDLTKSC